MDRKRAAWTSWIAVALLSASLFFGPAIWAAESRGDTRAQEASVDLGIDLLDWLRQTLDVVWGLLEGSEGDDSHFESPTEEPPVEDPPVAEVGPGMVPIG